MSEQYVKGHTSEQVKKLLKKGVIIPNSETVDIGEEVDVKRISGNGVVLYSGCKILGKSTLILQNSKIGFEGPVTLDNCFIGPAVDLKGGFFKKAVFLKNSSMGSGAHVREGTILEEEAGGAHTVGLKQTILFPFVTLGSLINFCDCFMSGGTSRKDHSEVGSSYIHFNYTPNQDKATPSLIGDVPRGVMLDQRPVFLGGQGGLVGPCRLAFGTVVSAGSICRKDETRENRLIIQSAVKSCNIPFSPGRYQNNKKILHNNIIYIANLIALREWYLHIRSMFVSDNFPDALLLGLNENIELALDERVKRLKEVCLKIPGSDFYILWPKIEELLDNKKYHKGDTALRDNFLEKIYSIILQTGKNYISVIKNIETADKAKGTAWLQGIVDNITFGINVL
ncbi:MAG: protein GlmU [Deltaproteobacteria bacterium]|nr:protein GlmU [Deltaproteobacteria bacterium]